MTPGAPQTAQASTQGDPDAAVPVWLLDVDGVVNAVSRFPDPKVWDDWQSGTAVADGTEWPITFSPSVTGTIRRLHEQGLVEVRWLTTWRGNANGSLRDLLGLPEFAVAGEVRAPEPVPDGNEPALDDAVPDDGASGAANHFHGAAASTVAVPADEWWKLTVVRSVVTEVGRDRPLIWTDDDLRYDETAVAWVRDQVTAALLIAPPQHTGLTPQQISEIEDFCRSHAVRRAGRPPVH